MTSKEFLATFTQAWNDHDVDKLMEHMDSDCAFYASVGFDEEGTKCVGWDEVKKALLVSGRVILMPSLSQ